MAARSNSVDMIHGTLWNKILKFVLTFMLTSFLQELYSAADVMVVGRYAGKSALAGVGTCTVIVNLFLNFVLGLAAGVTIVIGHAIGENADGIKKASHTSIALAIYGGLITSAICFVFSKWLLNLIDVPESVIPQANTYLKIISLGFIPSLVYNFGAAILRAKGDTKRPLYIVLVSGILNVALNVMFVCVFKMEAGGVALATVISQFFTAICVMYILCNGTDETRIFIREIRMYKNALMKILRYGIPSGIQSSVYSLSNIVVQSGVNSFGSAAIAGSAAATSLTNFYNVSVGSIYQASIVFTSQNFGAKKFDRIKKIMYICFLYVGILWLIQLSITYFFGATLLKLYIPNDPMAVEMGIIKLDILGYSYGLVGIMNVFSGTLRGMGASILNMFTSIIGVCGIRMLWLITAFKVIGTYESLYLCYPLSWLGTLIMHGFMVAYTFKKEKRKNR